MNFWKVSSLALAGALTLVVGRNAMITDADAGAQPHMQAALGQLEAAQVSLNKADADKGGHRAKALVAVALAITETKAGIAFDAERSDKDKGGGTAPGAAGGTAPSAPNKPKTERLANPK
jgi:hypothetical protein